jgi:hypothetical protein
MLGITVNLPAAPIRSPYAAKRNAGAFDLLRIGKPASQTIDIPKEKQPIQSQFSAFEFHFDSVYFPISSEYALTLSPLELNTLTNFVLALDFFVCFL